MIEFMPFAQLNGVALDEATPERVTGHLDWHADRCTTGGIMHGAALITLADSIGAICAVLNLPEGATTATISTSTNLLRAVRSGTAHATAIPLHVGSTTIVVETTVTDDDGRRVSTTVQAQAVLRPKPPT